MAKASIGTVAETLCSGGHFMTQIVLGACIVIGISLMVLAAVHYTTHRRNPKLVPLTKPIMYIVLGLCLLAIPFLDDYVAETGHMAAKKVEEKSHPTCYDIDAPIH